MLVWRVALMLLLVLLAGGVASQTEVPRPRSSRTSSLVTIRNLRVADVSEDSATLEGDVSSSAARPPNLVAHIGLRAGDWAFHVVLGDRPSATVRVSLEGLRPATRYYYAFSWTDGTVQGWSETPWFETLPAPFLARDAAWMAGLGPADIPSRGFVSALPASRWEEGLLTGNGTLGANAFGRPLDERIIVTHEKLFLPWHEPLPPVETASALPQVRALIAARHYQEAADLVVQRSRAEGYGPKRWTDMFIPAFDLRIRMGASMPGSLRHGQGTNSPHLTPATLQHYLRSLDYSTGVATVQWQDRGTRFVRRLFVSRADGVVVLAITASTPGAITCSLEFAPRPVDKVETYWREQEKFAEGIRSVDVTAGRGRLGYCSLFAKRSGGWRGLGRVIARQGRTRIEGHRLVVSGADQVLVVVGAEVFDTASPVEPGTLETRLDSLEPDFTRLLARHTEAHRTLYDRAWVDFGGGPDHRRPAEDLLARSTVEHTPPALIERVFDAGRYEILSASGDWPPNLQGLWTGTWGAPWSGDYTLNGNVQTAIASLLDGDLPECLSGFFDYVDGLLPASRENARRLYGARGVVIASRTSTHGFNNHFDSTWPMTFWTAGAAWLAHFYYDYYLHTGDLAFLRSRALPLMTAAASFYEDFLVLDANSGRYTFTPSYSPENNPRNSASQVTVDATMDVAVARELFRNLIAACRTLEVDPDGVRRWTALLERLPDYRVNADGALAEWVSPAFEDNYEHRHASHLYPLFYGMAPEFSARPDLQAAARRALDLRWRERARTGGGEMGFGAVQLGQAAATLGDGETVYAILRSLVNRHYYRNFASSHDPGPEIFNADLSGGVPELVIRMIVQTEPGRLDLLPALPRALAAGAIGGVLGRGQILVKRLHWDESTISALLWTPRAQTVTLSTPRGIRAARAEGAVLEEAAPSPRERRLALPACTDVHVRVDLDPR